MLVTWRVSIDADRAIATHVFGCRGSIHEDVLVADIVRDLLGNGVDLTHVFREEGDTTGLFRYGGQRSFCAALFFLAENADSVDRGSIVGLSVKSWSR